MNTAKPAQTDDDLRLLSREDLTDAPAITAAHVAFNRAVGRGARNERPARKGLLGVSEATFDRMVSVGAFPKPLRIGPRMVRWPARVVREWIEKQAATA